MKKNAIKANKQHFYSSKKKQNQNVDSPLFHFSVLLALNIIYELRHFVAVDPCASFPCQYGGNCSSTGSNYTCCCPSGFQGPTCEQGSLFSCFN